MRKILATLILCTLFAVPALAQAPAAPGAPAAAPPAAVKIHQTDLAALTEAARNVQVADLDLQRATAVKEAWAQRLEALRLRALMLAGCTDPDAKLDSTTTIEAAAALPAPPPTVPKP